MTLIITLIIAYLLGSLSTSLIISKITGKEDPRKSGSGNAGATNVLRTQGKQQAIIVLIGDVLKGVIAVWLARAAGLTPFWLGMAGVVAVIGHIFPVFFQFKGGKGVATAFGVVLCLSFWAGILAAAVFVIMLYMKNYVSLASVTAAIASPFLLALVGHDAYFIPGVIIAALVYWKHQANMDRIKNKTEPTLKKN